MKNLFLDHSIDIITKYYKKCNSEEIEKLKYGLEGLYLTITKLVIITILAIILNVLIETIIVLLFFNIIRYFAFGFHAKKSSECLITSIILFIALPLIISYIHPNLIIKIFISMLCIISMILFAPADTIKRPLINIKKRRYRKISSTILAIIYTMLIVFVPINISEIILCSLIIQSVMINPITYKIFKQPYNNYLTYNKV